MPFGGVKQSGYGQELGHFVQVRQGLLGSLGVAKAHQRVDQRARALGLLVPSAAPLTRPRPRPCGASESRG
jgi:hypothetical protein